VKNSAQCIELVVWSCILLRTYPYQTVRLIMMYTSILFEHLNSHNGFNSSCINCSSITIKRQGFKDTTYGQLSPTEGLMSVS